MALSDASNQVPILNVGSYSALTGSKFVYVIDYVDSDLDDVFTYAAANIPSWLTFNQQVGLLYGTPEMGDVGTYDVDITVADNHGGSDTETISIIVDAQQSNSQFVESDALVIWDPKGIVDDTRKDVLISYENGNASQRLAILGINFDPILGGLHEGLFPLVVTEGLVYAEGELIRQTRIVNTENGLVEGTLTDKLGPHDDQLMTRLITHEVLTIPGANVMFVGDNGEFLGQFFSHSAVSWGEIDQGTFTVDGSSLPASSESSGWDYTFIPLLDPLEYGVTKQVFIGSSSRNDFYASGSPDEFITNNATNSMDHITYHAIAQSPIEVDFDAGLVLKDGAGNQDMFEPHKFGLDATMMGDEFYGIDNERIDGNGGDDFYHSFVDDAQGFNLRVGLGADLVVPTTNLSGSKWKTGDVRLSPDAFWNAGFYAENVDTAGGGIGTGELISLSGMGRYTDIIICTMEFDANDQALMIMDDVTFHLGEYVDTPSHDAFFLDDAFSARHAETEASFSNRIGQHERFTSMQTLYAGDGDDLIDLSSARYENKASAAIFGEEGNDILWGGDSPEMLDGGAGDDVLFGGMGSDILIGGAGSDEFQFTATSTTAPQDFNPAEDSITVFKRIGIDDDFVVEVDDGNITLGHLDFGTFDAGLTLDDISVSYEEIHGGLVVTFTAL